MHDLKQTPKDLAYLDGASAIVEFEVAAGTPSRLVCDGPVPVGSGSGRSPPVTLLGAVASAAYFNSTDASELVLRFHATDSEGVRCHDDAVKLFLEQELRNCDCIVEWEDKRFGIPDDIASQHAVRSSEQSQTT
jgi:hypothetical protein